MINEMFTQGWFDTFKGTQTATLEEVRNGATRFLVATNQIAAIQEKMGKRQENAVEQLLHMKKHFTRSEIANCGSTAERDLEKWQKRLEKFNNEN